jgi:hypothetical protein
MTQELEQEIDRLQSAINVAVWHLEGEEHDAALCLLKRHYDESVKHNDIAEAGDDGRGDPNEGEPKNR